VKVKKLETKVKSSRSFKNNLHPNNPFPTISNFFLPTTDLLLTARLRFYRRSLTIDKEEVYRVSFVSVSLHTASRPGSLIDRKSAATVA
jgi:hypothetical protein